MRWRSLLLCACAAALLVLASAQPAPPTPDEDVEAELRKGKIALICVVGVMTLAASLLPWYIHRRLMDRAISVMGVCCCLAAGIMLGAALCHIFPEATHSFEKYLESHSSPADSSSEPAGHDHGLFPYQYAIAGAVLIVLVAIDNAVAHQGTEFDTHVHPHQSGSTRAYGTYEHLPADEVDRMKTIARSFGSGHGHGHDPEHDHGHSRGSKKQVLEAWVFFVALSLHSIFDGMSIGAEGDLDGFYSLMVAVLSHKLLDGFALGVPVYRANFSNLHAGVALVFCAAMTPLGIGLGWAVTSLTEGDGAVLAKAVIMSISAGSFLFISLLELLPTGLAGGDLPWVKSAACAAGFAFMALLALWV